MGRFAVCRVEETGGKGRREDKGRGVREEKEKGKGKKWRENMPPQIFRGVGPDSTKQMQEAQTSVGWFPVNSYPRQVVHCSTFKLLR